MGERNLDTHGRLLARLVRQLVATEHFETLADLTDALKGACARLHIQWTTDDIGEAYRLIESNRPLLTPPARAVVDPRGVEDGRPFSPDEAKAMWARLRAALVRTGAEDVRDIPTMTAVRQLSDAEVMKRQRRADQHKAYVLIQQQILDTAQRVAALEATIETDHGKDDHR